MSEEVEYIEDDNYENARFATATFEILAEQIVDMIISGKLISVQCAEDISHGCVCVWSPIACEQIAAHIQSVIQPEEKDEPVVLIESAIKSRFGRIKSKIREIVEETGDPLMSHFIEAMPEEDAEFIKQIVRALVQDGVLRMKEDSIDHEYSYRKGRNWITNDKRGRE